MDRQMYAPILGAFVKKRRNRPDSVVGKAVGKPACVRMNHSSVCSNKNEEDESASSASSRRFPLDMKPAARCFRGGSAGYEGDKSCDNDRQSQCSSPLSDSSSFSSEIPDDDSVYCDIRFSLDEEAFPRRRANSSSLFLVGSDIMAQVLTYLDASEILSVLTMPLCKEWQRNYGSNQDLWKTMCLLEPFKANLVVDADTDDDSYASLPVEPAIKNIFGEYRLMFTSFVRCLRYLERIQTDARQGRPPSANDNRMSGFPHFGVSKSLKRFLHKKKDVFGSFISAPVAAVAPIQTNPVGVTDCGYRKRSAPSMESMSKKPRYGNSMITSRLLGPSSQGDPSHLQLPRSCAIYSIVNWMVAYPEVEGIQIRCIETLPFLLEDESQRLLAQRVGLVEVVLRAMLRFPSCPKLHIAAFHAMVLLARPLGGREGMLFDNSMAESSTTNAAMELMAQSPNLRNTAHLECNVPSRLNGISGINVMLDSMRRFQDKADLQAMACWALVNLALVPAQKAMILSLGGIEVALNAMRRHPADADVQFRALFSLINLVVAPLPATNYILDGNVDEIATLVVRAMTNFCSSVAVLNRACLVLHNLAQKHDYLTILLWTPHCYQMIEWCYANFPTDPVLQRATTSILHRLQALLTSDERLRERFVASLRSQEGLALAHSVSVESDLNV